MASKPKARDPADKSRSEKQKQKEQSARFIDAARKEGVNLTDFEFAMSNIVAKKHDQKRRS